MRGGSGGGCLPKSWATATFVERSPEVDPEAAEEVSLWVVTPSADVDMDALMRAAEGDGSTVGGSRTGSLTGREWICAVVVCAAGV